MAAARRDPLQCSNRDQAERMEKLIVNGRVVNSQHVRVQRLLQRVCSERTGSDRDKRAQCSQSNE